MLRLLLASNNQGKLTEIKDLLSNFEIHFILPLQLGVNLDVKEDGTSYEENASRKALAYAEASGLLTLADDSGLEVDALGGDPGIRSARYAPMMDARDADRRAYLVEKLQEYPRPWIARFCCIIALLKPGRDIYYTRGYCQGEIIPEEHGENGFGYDPIFFLPAFGKTMAELSMAKKNTVSHRSRAIQSLKPVLEALIAEERSEQHKNEPDYK